MTTEDTEPSLSLYDWSLLQVHLVWAYEGVPKVPSGARTIMNLVAWYLKRGSLLFRCAGREYSVQAGEWWMPPPKRATERSFSSDAEVFSISFEARWPDGTSLFEEKQPHRFAGEDCPELLRATQRLVRFVGERFPAACNELPLKTSNLESHLILNALLLKWIVEYASVMRADGAAFVRQADADPRVVQACSLIDHWDFNLPFKPAVLAATVGVSEVQLNRLMVDGRHRTVKQYFDEVRAQKAIRLLRQAEMQVKEVGFVLGFKQPSHFTRWFRARTNESPLAFREHAARQRGSKAT